MNKKNYTTWFQHDSNAMNNRNLKALRSAYGMEGIGCWWTLQEILSTQPGYQLDISNEYAINELADDLRMDAGYVERYVNDCVNKFHLLQCDDTHLWCPVLTASLEPLDEKRARQSERGKKGAAVTNAKKKSAQATETGAKGSAQAKHFSTQNKTEQNKTEQNNTIQHNYPAGNDDKESLETKIVPVVNPSDAPADLDVLLQRVLADDIHFCSYHIRPGALKDKPALQGWLLAFNKWLRYGGEHIRNEHSYRIHFKNWLLRQDLRRNPAAYDPVTDSTAFKPKAAIPLEMPRKTAKEVLAQQAIDDEIMLRKLRSM